VIFVGRQQRRPAPLFGSTASCPPVTAKWRIAMTTVTHAKPDTDQPGIPCPDCGTFIAMSAMELLRSASFTCSKCGVRLSMDRTDATKAATAIMKFEQMRQQALSGNKMH
jgi:predicted RNA-binding Zn-ribbon protein involved in translation (DUF1610 family)